MKDIIIKLKHENSKDISTIYIFSSNDTFIKEEDKLYEWNNIPHLIALLSIVEKVEYNQYEFYDKETELLFSELVRRGRIYYGNI